MDQENTTISSDEIRAMFASALSEMYRLEVPQYGTLLELVADVNQSRRAQLGIDLHNRVEVERHGAIRLGTSSELAIIRRLFSIMGMEPVGYYDLSVAGLPVHATAFRPVTKEALARNPFRVFTSLLRMDAIQDISLRETATKIVEKRQIFTPRCLELVSELESLGLVPVHKATEFVHEALETFRWHQTSTVDLETYKALHAAHPLIADVVCFRGPHMNHLTPRVLDIQAAQAAMASRGLQAKEEIEGPPIMKNLVLLRQTSFLALEEKVAFSGGQEKDGKHKARFGEIEQRGVALTPKGRRLYDNLFSISGELAAVSGRSRCEVLTESFRSFPDDLAVLRREGLAYFTYSLGHVHVDAARLGGIDDLVDAGVLTVEPITYEDFLPVSAAGIFHSNLGSGEVEAAQASADQPAFEAALQATVQDPFSLYEEMERESIAQCMAQLKEMAQKRGAKLGEARDGLRLSQATA